MGTSLPGCLHRLPRGESPLGDARPSLSAVAARPPDGPPSSGPPKSPASIQPGERTGAVWILAAALRNLRRPGRGLRTREGGLAKPALPDGQAVCRLVLERRVCEVSSTSRGLV